jgi:hypothetical protein
MNRRTTFTLTGIVSLGLLIGAAGARALAQSGREGCTLANVAGMYGAYGGGTILPGNALGASPGPFATIGLVELTAQGSFIIVNQSISFNGMISRGLSSRGGVYTIKLDCTGSIDNGGGDTADLVFVNSRDVFYVVDTATGVVGNFVFTRVTTGGS